MKKTYNTSKTPSQRQLQVGELLRHALAEIFIEGLLYDEKLRGKSITVSEVRVTPDLRSATAYVMPLGGTNDKWGFLKDLARATPALRTMAAKQVKLRFMPELYFRLDDSFDRASHVDALLRHVAEDVESDNSDNNAEPDNNAS